MWILIKVLDFKGKKICGYSEKMEQVMYNEKKIRFSSGFLKTRLDARRKWRNIFKKLKEYVSQGFCVKQDTDK